MRIRTVETATLGRQFAPYLKAVEWEEVAQPIGGASPIRLTAIDPVLANGFDSKGPALEVRHLNSAGGKTIVEGLGVFD